MVNKSRPISQDELTSLWHELENQFKSQIPNASDLSRIENCLVLLLRQQVQHLESVFSHPGTVPAVSICTADIDNNGFAELYIVRQNGEVQFHTTSPEKMSHCKATLPQNKNQIILGLATYSGWLGRPQVGLVTTENGQTAVYDIQIQAGAKKEKIVLNRQLRSPLSNMILLPHWVGGDRITHLIEIEEKFTLKKRKFYELQVKAQTFGERDLIFKCPFRPRIILHDENSIFLSGNGSEILCLQLDADSSGKLQPKPLWKPKITSSVTAMTLFKEAGRQPLLIVAGEDGYLYGLNYVKGEVEWCELLPKVPLALSTGDVDGNETLELIIGYHDGLVEAYKVNKFSFEGWHRAEMVKTAVSWVMQTGSTIEIINRWLYSNQIELVDWAIHWFVEHRTESATRTLGETLIQNEPEIANQLLTRWFQMNPTAEQARDITIFLQSLPTPIDPSVQRGLARLQPQAEHPIDISQETNKQKLIAAWIDSQQGVRYLWRIKFSEIIISIHPVYHTQRRTTLLWIITYSKDVILFDLNVQEEITRWQNVHPVRGLIPAPGKSASAAWGVLADGTLNLYHPDHAQPQVLTQLATETWSLTASEHAPLVQHR